MIQIRCTVENTVPEGRGCVVNCSPTRRIRPVLVVLVLGLTSYVSAAGNDGGKATTSTAEPVIWFDGKSLDKKLPFDQPFSVQSKDGSPKLLSVYWRDRTALAKQELQLARLKKKCARRAGKCSDTIKERISELEAATRGVRELETVSCKALPDGDGEWWVSSPSNPPPPRRTQVPTQFRIHPLEPNRHYSLCMSVKGTPTDSQRKRDRAIIEQALLRFFGDVGVDLEETDEPQQNGEISALERSLTGTLGLDSTLQVRERHTAEIIQVGDRWSDQAQILLELPKSVSTFDAARETLFDDSFGRALAELLNLRGAGSLLTESELSAVMALGRLDVSTCDWPDELVIQLQLPATPKEWSALVNSVRLKQLPEIRKLDTCYRNAYEATLTNRALFRYNAQRILVTNPKNKVDLSRSSRATLAGVAQDSAELDQLASSLHAVTSRLSELLANYARIDSLLAKLTAGIAKTVADNHLLYVQTNPYGYDTLKNAYIGVDAGFAFLADIDEVKPYVGANFYFRPINKDVRIGSLGSWRETLNRRVALTVGFTLSSIDKTGERRDLFGSQSLVVGFGLRLSNSLRLSAGTAVFKELSPNPLQKDEDLALTPFVSFSFDWDVAKKIGKVVFDK